MKKVVCAVALLAAAGMCFANKLEDQLKSAIIKSEPCEYQKVYQNENIYKYKGEITYAQMEEDLANLKYILETSYAGYDDACARGMNLDTVISNIKEKFAGQETVYSRDMAMKFCEETRNYIKDWHFEVILGNTANWFCLHEFVYYADFYVETTDAENFSSEEGQLFPYYKNGKEMLRVGRIESELVNDVTFTLNGKKYQLPVKYYPVDTPSGRAIYEEKSTIQSAYVRLESFMPDGSEAAEANFNRFINFGRNYIDKQNVIVDLRTNQGGLLTYGDKFMAWFLFNGSQKVSDEVTQKIYNTITEKRCEVDDGCFKLITPATVQLDDIDIKREAENSKKDKKYKTTWTAGTLKSHSVLKKWMKKPSKIYMKTKCPDAEATKMKFPKVPAFKGKMFILADRNSASASEEFVLMAKKCLGDENVILIGENSLGCISYGALYNYSLPNSEVTFHIASESDDPAMRKLSNWQGEGNGLYPDIWSTDEDMLETLVAVTGDEVLREVLEGMN